MDLGGVRSLGLRFWACLGSMLQRGWGPAVHGGSLSLGSDLCLWWASVEAGEPS